VSFNESLETFGTHCEEIKKWLNEWIASKEYFFIAEFIYYQKSGKN